MSKRVTNEARCQMTGEYAADGWKHLGRHGIKRNYRCPNVATWRANGRTLLCDACRKHLRAVAKAKAAVAEMRMAFVRSAKRLKP